MVLVLQNGYGSSILRVRRVVINFLFDHCKYDKLDSNVSCSNHPGHWVRQTVEPLPNVLPGRGPVFSFCFFCASTAIPNLCHRSIHHDARVVVDDEFSELWPSNRILAKGLQKVEGKWDKPSFGEVALQKLAGHFARLHFARQRLAVNCEGRSRLSVGSRPPFGTRRASGQMCRNWSAPQKMRGSCSCYRSYCCWCCCCCCCSSSSSCGCGFGGGIAINALIYWVVATQIFFDVHPYLGKMNPTWLPELYQILPKVRVLCITFYGHSNIAEHSLRLVCPGNDATWFHNFSDGLVQPPTR